MKLKSIDLPFVLLTSAMNGGAQENGPAEVRIASIRGQVRAWHRKAGLTPACDEVWGRAADGATTASRVSLSLLPQLKAETHKDEPILPHHPVGGIRSAVTHNQTFTLRLTRLIGCNSDHWQAAQNAVKIWLLLGGLGLRSSRAAGSVWPVDDPASAPWVPADPSALRQCLITLGLARTSLALIGLGCSSDAKILRTTASDTVEQSEVFGAIRPHRIPSPTRFKVARFSGGLCLIATADQRNVPVNRQTLPMIQHAENLLVTKRGPARWRALGPWQVLIP